MRDDEFHSNVSLLKRKQENHHKGLCAVTLENGREEHRAVSHGDESAKGKKKRMERAEGGNGTTFCTSVIIHSTNAIVMQIFFKERPPIPGFFFRK